MNQIILSGRLTKDPEVRASQDGNTLIARYSIAVDRIGKDNQADFVNCTAFNKNAEFTEKYLKKGMKLIVQGSLHCDSYTNKDGHKVYTTEVYVERTEFCESKRNDSFTGDQQTENRQSGAGKYSNR